MSHPFDKSAIEAAARRALIAADPAYYSWSREQQEIFRATMDDDARSRIRRSLLASLHRLECGSKKEINDTWEAVSIPDLYPLNWALLFTLNAKKNGPTYAQKSGPIECAEYV